MERFAGRRYRAAKLAERARFGSERVQRVDLYPYGERPRDEEGAPLALRDELVRALVLRCEHRGEGKFVVALRPVDDPAAAAATALRMQPVVMVVLVIDAARLTREAVDRIAGTMPPGDVRIEVPYRPASDTAVFRTAVARAHNASIPIVARAMSGPAGRISDGFAGLETLAGERAVTGLHLMPWQRLDAPAGYDGDPLIPPVPAAESPPAREDYLAATADLIEHVPPTLEIDLRAYAGPAELVSAPTWLAGGRLGADLTALLARRGSYQSSRLTA